MKISWTNSVALSWQNYAVHSGTILRCKGTSFIDLWLSYTCITDARSGKSCENAL